MTDHVSSESLTSALSVLNQYRHRGYQEWVADGVNVWPNDRDADRYEYLESFEAIAIAEKYLRDDESKPVPWCQPHQKVYGTIVDTIPPVCFWKCAICGQCGADQGEKYARNTKPLILDEQVLGRAGH